MHDHEYQRLDTPEEKVGNGILNSFGKIIAVMSGKGGVGKSSVTSMLAVSLRRQGKKVGVLDADITGPSIPKLFGVNQYPEQIELGILPPKTRENIFLMSMNLLLENPEDPVIWRGPIIGGAIKQFWEEIIWGKLDYLLIDLPPGTGDAPLTVLQTIPVDKIVVVSSPQDLANMVVKKAITMAKKMDVEVMGIVENMSGFICPHCNEEIKIFGESNVIATCKETETEFLGKLNIDPKLSELGDKGLIEDYNGANMEVIRKITESL